MDKMLNDLNHPFNRKKVISAYNKKLVIGFVAFGCLLVLGGVLAYIFWPRAKDSCLFPSYFQDRETFKPTFSKDGKYLAFGYDNLTVKVLDLSSSTEIGSFDHEGKITSLAFSSDNKYLASAATDNFVRVFSLESQAEVSSYKNQGGVYLLHFCYDNSELAALRNDYQMLVWSLKDGNLVSHITIYGFLEAFNFSRTHNEFAIGGRDGEVKVYDIHSVKTRYELTYNAPINRIRFDSQNDELIVQTQDGKLIYTKNLHNSIEEKIFPYDILHYPLLNISEDIQHVVVGGKNALVFDVKNGIQVAELKHEWHLTSVAISKLGDIVITADEKREIRVWSVKKQVVFTQFKVSEDVSSIKFSPDEKYFTVEGQAGWSRVYSKNDNSQDS